MPVHHVSTYSYKCSKFMTSSSCQRWSLGALQRRNNAPRMLANNLKRGQLGARRFSTNNGASPGMASSESPVRVYQLLGALLVIGIGATSWGLYEFYTTLTMWPKEVRGELRAGLRAKHRGDMKLATKHLTRAWQMVQKLSPDDLSPDPYLKFSGVAIVLAEVLESEQDLDEAFSVLKTALVAFAGDQTPHSPISSTSQNGEQVPEPESPTLPSTDPTGTPWSARSPPRISMQALLNSSRTGTISSELNSKARMRAVSLALKLGDLAETLKRPEEEERWLGFAVIEVLKLVRDEYGLVHDVRQGFMQATSESKDKSGEKASSGEDAEVHKSGVRDILSPSSDDDELGLPTWASLTKSELAAPMERLGSFYSRQGQYGYAILLYRVASSLLVRPSSARSPHLSRPTIVELCQALQIENAHMALMMNVRRSHPKDAKIQRDLPRILTRAVQIYDEAVKQHENARSQDDSVESESEMMLCDQTFPAVMFNAAIYYEEQGQLEAALRSFTLSYKALRANGSREMMYEAMENARRLQRVINKNAKQAPQDLAQNGSGNSTRSSDPLDNSARQ